MIKIHHLGVSQSDRVVWLMEELELPYELVWYDRGPNGLQPPEYQALHPAATAPVIDDGERRLTESAVILEYICRTHAKGRLCVDPGDPSYFDYLYWMHWNNNIQGLFFAKLALGDRTDDGAKRVGGFVTRRQNGYYRHLDERLAQSEYLAGSAFTCADIMVTFNLTSLSLFGARGVEDLTHVKRYVAQVTARPAYRKAMEVAGPGAKRPS